MTKRKLFFCLSILLICIGVIYFSINDNTTSTIASSDKATQARLKAAEKKCDCCKKLKDFRKRYEERRKQEK